MHPQDVTTLPPSSTGAPHVVHPSPLDDRTRLFAGASPLTKSDECAAPSILPPPEAGPLSQPRVNAPVHQRAGGFSSVVSDQRSVASGFLADADGIHLDPRFAQAQRWHATIRQVEELMRGGCSANSACAQIGIDAATFSRWRRRYNAGGRTLQALLPKHRGPRHHVPVMLDEPKFAMKLSELYLSTLGASCDQAATGRRTGKVATTLWLFAEEPECPPALAERLRAGAQPEFLVKYLKRVTPELEARIRGPKHAQLSGGRSQRDMTFRITDGPQKGQRAHVMAGTLWEFDDMSVNQPFWCEQAGTVSERVSEPVSETGSTHPLTHSPTHTISRQGLYARDVRSGRWLGVELIARPREAYRAADILRFFRRLFEIYGVPRRIRLEKSVWASRTIKGVKIRKDELHESPEETFDRPAMTEQDKQFLQDGLGAIGVQVQYAQHAHIKTIEGAFNLLQTVIATRTREFVNIGRHAGEFEHGAKAMRRVRGESHHPRDVGFPHIDVMADRVDEACALVNSRPARRLQGRTPDAVWTDETGSHPLTPLDPEHLHVFLADLREGTVMGGAVWPAVDGRKIEFRHTSLIQLGTGYRVFVRFDETEPTLGAAIYSREQGTRAHEGHRPGQLICLADYIVPAPQANLTAAEAAGLPTESVRQLYGEGAVDTGARGRKAGDAQVRTAFRAAPMPGQPRAKASTIRDGKGNVASVERSAPGTGKGEREKGRAGEISAEISTPIRRRASAAALETEWI